MKSPRLLAVLFIGLIAPILAQIPVAAATNAATNHCLWEVKGASNTVFLVGSMHLMRDDMYPLPEVFESAFKRSSIAVFETDMKAVQSPALALKLAAKAMYPEGESLKKNLSPATYSLLASNLQSSFLSLEVIDRMKPWMAAMTMLLMELQKEGFDVQNGVDKHFYSRAVADGKKVDYFEPPDFQINLLTSLDNHEGEEFLGQAMRDMSVWKKQFADLAQAWRTGDTAALDKLVVDSFREYPAMLKKFLLDRNAAWIEKTEKLLHDEKDAFIVVGAAHLIGKGSVVDLLQAKGYQITQR